MIGKPNGPDVVVKIGLAWGEGEGERLHAAMSELADTVSAAGIPDAAAIRPLAWAASPPALVMPYVAGIDLV